MAEADELRDIESARARLRQGARNDIVDTWPQSCDEESNIPDKCPEGCEADLAKVGAAKRAESKVGNKNASANKTTLSPNDNDESTAPKHNTQAELAKAANISTGMAGMAEAGGEALLQSVPLVDHPSLDE